jgi:hypothetical protein
VRHDTRQYDTQLNVTQHNDILHNNIIKYDTQYNDTQHNDSFVMLSVVNKPFIPSVIHAGCYNAEFRCAGCHFVKCKCAECGGAKPSYLKSTYCLKIFITNHYLTCLTL